jgi:hypothetical protein
VHCHCHCQLQNCRGSLLNFLGCSLDPPTFASAIRCHQKSTSNSAGSSVGSLAPPPATGHPAARRCVRVVPVLPLLLCTRPARARPSVGGQSPTPAPRQLPWGPPRGWCSGRLPYSNFEQLAHKDSCLQNEIDTTVVPRSPWHRQRIPCGTKE